MLLTMGHTINIYKTFSHDGPNTVDTCEVLSKTAYAEFEKVKFSTLVVRAVDSLCCRP